MDKVAPVRPSDSRGPWRRSCDRSCNSPLKPTPRKKQTVVHILALRGWKHTLQSPSQTSKQYENEGRAFQTKGTNLFEEPFGEDDSPTAPRTAKTAADRWPCARAQSQSRTASRTPENTAGTPPKRKGRNPEWSGPRSRLFEKKSKTLRVHRPGRCQNSKG